MERTHFVLLLLAVVLSTFASIYYVLPDDGQFCPPGNECHILSYYIPVSQVYGSEREENLILVPHPHHVYQHGERESPMSPFLTEREPQ